MLRSKTYWIALLSALSPLVCYGQKYSYQEVKIKSEQVLLTLIRADMAKNCSYDTGTYYSYVTSHGDTTWGMLQDDKITQGHVINIFTRYFMRYVYPKCPEYDTILCSITLQLNSNLELYKEPDLSVIPDFVLKDEGCHLLTIKQAKDIAKEKYLLPSDDEPFAHIFYDHVKKRFTWTIQSFYYDVKHNSYRPQFITLDASTGKLISD